LIEREQYINNHTTKQNELLQNVEAYTLVSHAKAHMVSGAYQGRLLSMISCLVKPAYILEIGTFTGFSALCLAEGLLPNGQLHTIENREDDAKTAQEFFNKTEAKNKIFLHIGNALEVIPNLNFEWDIVFIDADKTAYIDYYEMVLPKMKKGSIIIADNVLFHNQVLEEEIKGKSALAIHAFNQHVQQDERAENIMLPIRDGITLIRKK
jgi:caffeoyl-CoA O-methyltransferase